MAVLAVMAVSVMTATPLNSTPLFRDPESLAVFAVLFVVLELYLPSSQKQLQAKKKS